MHHMHHVRLVVPKAFLSEVTESIKQSFSGVINSLHLVKVAQDSFHVSLEMHWGTVVSSLSVSKRAHLVHELGQLSLNIELVLVVHLESHILDRVSLESDHVLLTCQEERKRNVEQNVLDVWLDQLSGVFEPHAHGQELD